MECLPDEALINIFFYLHPKIRMKLEFVSTRWYKLMPYSDLRDINLLTTLASNARISRMDTFPMSGGLSALVLRAGKSLQKVSFGHEMLLVTPTALRLVDEYCPNVTDLDLSYCKVTENIVEPIMLFRSRLKSLNLANTAFSITDVAAHIDNMALMFSSLQCLYSINLQRTNMFNLRAIPYLPTTVKRVNLNNCGPLRQDTMLAFLTGERQLEELRLSAYLGVEETIFDVICSMESLKVLDLSHMAIGDLISHNGSTSLDFSQLGRLKNLEELYVQFNNTFSSAALRSVAMNCPKLRVLNIANCRRLDNYYPLQLMANLREVKIAATNAFSDKVLVSMSNNLKNLEVFEASCCYVTDKGLKALVEGSRGTLNKLNLDHCNDLTDDAMSDVINLCPKLNDLHIQRTSVTDVLLLILGNSLDMMKNRNRKLNLDVSFCDRITDNGLEILRAHIKSQAEFLGKINVQAHQTKITKTAVKDIEDRRLRVSL